MLSIFHEGGGNKPFHYKAWCHLNLVPLPEKFLQPGQTAVTDESVPADLDVLQAGDVGGHVLQGGQVVVAQVEAPQAGQVGRGRRAEVGEAGVVGETDGPGEREPGEAGGLHPPQQGAVAHLNTVSSTSDQNTQFMVSFSPPWGGLW